MDGDALWNGEFHRQVIVFGAFKELDLCYSFIPLKELVLPDRMRPRLELNPQSPLILFIVAFLGLFAERCRRSFNRGSQAGRNSVSGPAPRT